MCQTIVVGTRCNMKKTNKQSTKKQRVKPSITVCPCIRSPLQKTLQVHETPCNKKKLNKQKSHNLFGLITQLKKKGVGAQTTLLEWNGPPVCLPELSHACSWTTQGRCPSWVWGATTKSPPRSTEATTESSKATPKANKNHHEFDFHPLLQPTLFNQTSGGGPLPPTVRENADHGRSGAPISITSNGPVSRNWQKKWACHEKSQSETIFTFGDPARVQSLRFFCAAFTVTALKMGEIQCSVKKLSETKRTHEVNLDIATMGSDLKKWTSKDARGSSPAQVQSLQWELVAPQSSLVTQHNSLQEWSQKGEPQPSTSAVTEFLPRTTCDDCTCDGWQFFPCIVCNDCTENRWLQMKKKTNSLIVFPSRNWWALEDKGFLTKPEDNIVIDLLLLLMHWSGWQMVLDSFKSATASEGWRHFFADGDHASFLGGQQTLLDFQELLLHWSDNLSPQFVWLPVRVEGTFLLMVTTPLFWVGNKHFWGTLAATCVWSILQLSGRPRSLSSWWWMR